MNNLVQPKISPIFFLSEKVNFTLQFFYSSKKQKRKQKKTEKKTKKNTEWFGKQNETNRNKEKRFNENEEV